MKSLFEIGYEEDSYQKLSSFLIMKYGLYPCKPIDFKVKLKKKNYSHDFVSIHFIMNKMRSENSRINFLLFILRCTSMISMI